jgi:Na+-transporting NADH:ubiquinone oxidoreductase subunit NqrB
VSSLAALLGLQRIGKRTQVWLTTAGVVVGGILCASSLLARESVANGEFLFTVTSNFAALLLGAVMITVSLIEERRAVFWLGALYLVLIILSRFLEYETSLLVKSAAFLACGIAVIFAGISYETYMRRKDVPSPEGGNGL